MAVDSGNFSSGGSRTVSVPAVAQTIQLSGPGRLCRLEVIVGGTTSVSFYDSQMVGGIQTPSLASATVLKVIPGSVTPGTPYDIQMPAQFGVTAVTLTTSPVMTASIED